MKPYDVMDLVTNSSGNDLSPIWHQAYIHSKVWDEITYPFPNVNGETVWEW